VAAILLVKLVRRTPSTCAGRRLTPLCMTLNFTLLSPKMRTVAKSSPLLMENTDQNVFSLQIAIPPCQKWEE
jgi:hypothetical protein